MSSAAAVKAGKVFVEISANDTKFQAAVKRVHNRMAGVAASMKQVGTAMTLGATALGLPMVLAARSAATFEDAILELKGSVADISPKQLEAVREEALRLSREMGRSPTEIAKAFALLIKAGMTVDEALNGAAKSAVEFAAVSGVAADQAAVFMKVAMNTFGVSATEAVDTLSAAADASETSIAAMVESFSLVGSAGKTLNQSLFGISQGLAALAKYGVQGEEAGTGIKVFLTRLVAPSNEAREALGRLGLSVESFRDAKGDLLPMVQMVDVLSKAMKNMGDDAFQKIIKDASLVDVFGDRGIKVISAFADMGVDGFQRIAGEMEKQRSVTEKFQIAMAGITGAFKTMGAAVERLAIAFAAGLGPALSWAAAGIAAVLDLISGLLTSIPVLSPILATLTAAVFALGVSLIIAGAAMQAVNFGLRGVLKTGPIYAAVMGGMATATSAFAAAVTALGTAFYALPFIGQVALIATALTAATAGVIYLATRKTKKAVKKSEEDRKKIKRDTFRDAMAGVGTPGGSDQEQRKSLGTFAGQIAAQLGIGPDVGPAKQTANNTARMADGIDELVRRGGEEASAGASSTVPGGMPAAASVTVPDAAAMRGTLTAAEPGVARGVAARSDAEMLSAADRTALATEKMVGLLRQAVEVLRNGGREGAGAFA